MHTISLDHGSIEFNTGELYFYLYSMIGDDNSFNLLFDYLTSLKFKAVRTRICGVLSQVSNILMKGRQEEVLVAKPKNESVKEQTIKLKTLPGIYCDEPWRGQKLILEILLNKLDSEKLIDAEIDYWATVEKKYL